MVPETGSLDHYLIRMAWNCAAQLVRTRPWLSISWIAHSGRGLAPSLCTTARPVRPCTLVTILADPCRQVGSILAGWDDVTPPHEAIDWAMSLALPT